MSDYISRDAALQAMWNALYWKTDKRQNLDWISCGGRMFRLALRRGSKW